MAEAVCREIRRFVAEEPGNRREAGAGPYFEEPLVGFASAADPLFQEYKRIIGPFHLTPSEWFEDAFVSASLGSGTVISWVLPIAKGVRESNRPETRLPSRAWAHTRHFGEAFNDALRQQVVDFLSRAGYRTVAPVLRPRWRTTSDPRVGLASSWSERHAAYAAGLGTFSLNDALITPRGIAHRLGSVVTELVLQTSPRPYVDHRENCLSCRGEECGMCIDRCPAGAISPSGHDKDKCRQYTYGEVMTAVGEVFGVRVAGCGLCQTKVPCERQIPPGARRDH
jgi:epoxyqueuosine reductase QueG